MQPRERWIGAVCHPATPEALCNLWRSSGRTGVRGNTGEVGYRTDVADEGEAPCAVTVAVAVHEGEVDLDPGVWRVQRNGTREGLG